MNLTKILEEMEKEILDLVKRDIGFKLVKIESSHDKVTVYVGLPGVVSSNNVEVTVYDDRVYVKARSAYFGTLEYTIDLPEPVKPETATATLKHGTLMVTAEKREKAYKVPVR